MNHWLLTDLLIVLLYGLQHSLLTTRLAVNIYNRLFPAYTWNLVYSVISVATLIVGFRYWEPSGVTLYRLMPGSFAYHVSVTGLALSLFLFFYCFKFTTSFWQWLGARQIVLKIMGKEMPEYYRVREQGIKRYIRFPHHTSLVFFFWLHPVMTLDTLLLSIAATVYLYVGTYHQDRRGLRIIGEEWAEYRRRTNLLFPGRATIRRFLADIGLLSTGARTDVSLTNARPSPAPRRA